MENNEVKEEREYTDKDVLKAVGKLSEERRNILLRSLTISDIQGLLNSKERYGEFYAECMSNIHLFKTIADALKELFETMDSKLKDDEKDFSADYDKLNDSDKKRVALEMLNDTDFQKNLCEIMLGDFERIVAEDPAYKAIDNFLGVGKFFRKCIETGLGCDHKYEVL